MFMNKKILALVPARGGSKGIKLKNIRRINKLSLIGYTSKFIDKCNFFDEKLLSTDSNKIVNEANRFKFKIFKRSTNTSKDYTSDFEVISEVLNHSEIYKKKYDYIIYLQPTSPIRKIFSAFRQFADLTVSSRSSTGLSKIGSIAGSFDSCSASAVAVWSKFTNELNWS